MELPLDENSSMLVDKLTSLYLSLVSQGSFSVEKTLMLHRSFLLTLLNKVTSVFQLLFFSSEPFFDQAYGFLSTFLFLAAKKSDFDILGLKKLVLMHLN